MMLERAGLQGMDYQWEYDGRAVESLEAVLPAGMEGGEWDSARLSAVVQAVKCDVCKRPGISSQCAACGKLLCRWCWRSCDGYSRDKRIHCPFVLCDDDYNPDWDCGSVTPLKTCAPYRGASPSSPSSIPTTPTPPRRAPVTSPTKPTRCAPTTCTGQRSLTTSPRRGTRSAGSGWWGEGEWRTC